MVFDKTVIYNYYGLEKVNRYGSTGDRRMHDYADANILKHLYYDNPNNHVYYCRYNFSVSVCSNAEKEVLTATKQEMYIGFVISAQLERSQTC